MIDDKKMFEQRYTTVVFVTLTHYGALCNTHTHNRESPTAAIVANKPAAADSGARVTSARGSRRPYETSSARNARILTKRRADDE